MLILKKKITQNPQKQHKQLKLLLTWSNFELCQVFSFFFFLSSVEEEMKYNVTYSSIKIQQNRDLWGLVKHYLFVLEICFW